MASRPGARGSAFSKRCRTWRRCRTPRNPTCSPARTAACSASWNCLLYDAPDDAPDAGVQPKSRWEKFKEAAKKAWDITVKIVTVVVAVLSALALVMGGPLVWGILFALSAVLLAESLANCARGEGSLLNVGLNMLGVIPGGRLLTALAAGRTAVTRMAANVRNGLGRRMTVLGGEAGSASVDTLTLGLSRLSHTARTHLPAQGRTRGGRGSVVSDAGSK